jgi:PAS domain S-box-containing protein
VAQNDDAAAPGGALTVALLDTLLHTAPVGIGFVDADLRFVRVNEVLAAMNGAPAEDHLGRRVDEVLDERLAATVAPILARTLETAQPTPDIEVANQDRCWVISYYPVHDGGAAKPVGVGVVVRDITEQRRIAQELDVRARHLEAVARLGQRALISDDFSELVHDGVALLVEILGVDYVHVLRHEREDSEFALQAAYGFEEAAGRRIPDDVSMQPGYALHHRLPVKIEDAASETRFRISPIFASLGVASALTVVIRGPGQPYGTLSIATLVPRPYTAEEVDFVQSMANVLGTAAARAKIDAALRAERERLQLALDAGGMGDWEWDMASDAVSWSDTLYRLFGVDPDGFAGTFDAYLDLVHPEDRQRLQDVVGAALEGGSDSYYIEHRIIHPDSSERWIGSNGQVRRDEAGTPFGLIGVAADITDRIEAEYKQSLLLAAEQEARAEAESARDRLEFLAEASRVLSGSLDYRETMTGLAHLAVSRLADWCAVDVVDEEAGEPTTVVVAHVDPDKIALAEEFRRRYPPDPDSAQGVAAVVRTAQPLMFPVVTDEMLAAAAVDDDHLAMLRTLQLRSAMVVPLVARGRALGAITLIGAESGRVYNEDDLALAVDLARRAGVAIDNARLYQERSQVAEALQRSLLPPGRPDIPGLEVAVRYRPVGQGTEIGGDFYDFFEPREGLWAVVIGDVCGKGTAAAALTGLARDTIRGVSLRERAPRRVLRVLNEVVLRREDEDSRFLTVALAMLEVDDSGARMRVACGGHPLPLVVRAGGAVEEAGTPGMLLGLFPDVDHVDAHLELGPGDAIVLFTDGVTEAQGDKGLFGESRLKQVLASAGSAATDAEGLAQAVIDAVDDFRPGAPQDDVAVVVLRVPPS